jgi:hypothetical protein
VRCVDKLTDKKSPLQRGHPGTDLPTGVKRRRRQDGPQALHQVVLAQISQQQKTPGHASRREEKQEVKTTALQERLQAADSPGPPPTFFCLRRQVFPSLARAQRPCSWQRLKPCFWKSSSTDLGLRGPGTNQSLPDTGHSTVTSHGSQKPRSREGACLWPYHPEYAQSHQRLPPSGPLNGSSPGRHSF